MENRHYYSLCDNPNMLFRRIIHIKSKLDQMMYSCIVIKKIIVSWLPTKWMGCHAQCSCLAVNDRQLNIQQLCMIYIYIYTYIYIYGLVRLKQLSDDYVSNVATMAHIHNCRYSAYVYMPKNFIYHIEIKIKFIHRSVSSVNIPFVKWKKMIFVSPINSLRSGDAHMRRQSNHHCFR